MTTPPQDPHSDPNLSAGDHEPTVSQGSTEPTRPLPPPTAQQPSYPPPPPGWSGGPAAPAAFGQPGPGQASFGAPYGIDPKTGLPFSDKNKIVAGVLQLVIPLGIGRMYTGHTGIGVAQLLVTLATCGIGALWPFIDGIITLVGDPRDANGRPLRS